LVSAKTEENSMNHATLKHFATFFLLLVSNVFAATEYTVKGSSDFGTAVAISGKTLAVINGPAASTGVVYVYQESNNKWSPVAQLTASDGTIFNAVSIYENTIVAGAASDTVNGNSQQGSAYVFVEGKNGWTDGNERARLTSSDGATDSYFGGSVAISVKTIIVGATNAGNVQQGEAYEFTEPSTGWASSTETAILTASDGQLSDGFGVSVSVNGVFAAVSARPSSTSKPGKAYLYHETQGGWQNMTQTAEITDADGNVKGFGVSSLLIAGVLVVGGAGGGDNGPNYYVAVYVEPESGWASSSTPTAELTTDEQFIRPGFGYALAANNKFIVVGDPNADDSINPHGQVFLYEKPKTGWASTTETKRFQPSGSGVHGVGYSVTATSSGAIFAGAPYTIIDGEDQGAVFGFFY
jgi:FG-GAP repeat